MVGCLPQTTRLRRSTTEEKSTSRVYWRWACWRNRVSSVFTGKSPFDEGTRQDGQRAAVDERLEDGFQQHGWPSTATSDLIAGAYLMAPLPDLGMPAPPGPLMAASGTLSPVPSSPPAYHPSPG